MHRFGAKIIADSRFRISHQTSVVCCCVQVTECVCKWETFFSKSVGAFFRKVVFFEYLIQNGATELIPLRSMIIVPRLQDSSSCVAAPFEPEHVETSHRHHILTPKTLDTGDWGSFGAACGLSALQMVGVCLQIHTRAVASRLRL